MRALVTGSAGFVGRHMIDYLDRTGWDTAGIDLTDGMNALHYFRTGTARWDLVVHAAASAPHRAAIDIQHEHMARNLMLDASMFDWAVRTHQRWVLYLSSSAAYPIDLQDDHATARRLREDDIRWEGRRDIGNPDAVYGWTKLTGERLAEQARLDGLPVTVVRPFSGYGEDQSENFPFRALIERARRREDPFTIWGDGNQVRDWIHIDDVIAGALAVVDSGTVQPVNLCTGTGVSMIELAQLACARVGYNPQVQLMPDRPAGVAYRVGDPSRFHQIYKPTVDLAEGVARALAD